MRWKLAVFAALPLAVVVTTVASRQVRTESECCDARAEGLLPESVVGLRTLNDAIAQRDAYLAARAWSDAYGAALGSRRWDALVATGDAALRIGELTGLRSPARADARKAYHSALFRAYGQRSIEGVLQTAEAMAVMGDHELAENALHLARKLAAATPNVELRARRERDIMRVADRANTTESASPRTDNSDGAWRAS